MSDAALHLKRKTWLGPRASDYNLTIEWSNCVSSEHLYSRLLKTKNYSLSLHKHSYLSHSPSHSCLTLQSIFRHHKPLHDRSLTRSHKNCFTYLQISFTLPIIPTSLSMSRKETLSHSGFFLSFIIRLFSLSLLIFLPHTLKTTFSPTL